VGHLRSIRYVGRKGRGFELGKTTAGCWLNFVAGAALAAVCWHRRPVQATILTRTAQPELLVGDLAVRVDRPLGAQFVGALSELSRARA